MLKFKNYLESKRHGSSTFEYTITLPMTIAIVSLLLFVFLLLTAWINYNALAGEIAKDLNFRQTGQSVAAAWAKRHVGGDNVMFTGTNSFGEEVPIEWGSITINGAHRGTNDKYTKCVGYSMSHHPKKFFMVYANYDNEKGTNVNFRSVSSTSDETFIDSEALSKNGRMSNHIVQVNVHWKFMPVTSFYWHWDGLDFTSTGYSVIT